MMINPSGSDWIPPLERRLEVLCPGHLLSVDAASWFFLFALEHESPCAKLMGLQLRGHQSQISCKNQISLCLRMPLAWPGVPAIASQPFPPQSYRMMCLTGHFRDVKCTALARCIYHGIKLGQDELMSNLDTRKQVNHSIEKRSGYRQDHCHRLVPNTVFMAAAGWKNKYIHV